MKITSALGKAIKPLVNFPRWMGARQLWANWQGIVKMYQDLRIHRPTVREESFEEAKERLKLTEDDVKNRMRTCFTLSIIYSFIALLFFVYTIYLILHLSLGMILGAMLTALMAVFAYREHFWYFQMKTRRLGNTFKDWLAFVLRGKTR